MHVIKESIFIILLLVGFAMPSHLGFADDDYRFKDPAGNEIQFSSDTQSFTQKKPGPWAKFKDFYKPSIKVKKRKIGLEDVTTLRISFSHPMEGEDSELGLISKIYILDKDDHVVAYHPFFGLEEKAYTELEINGVINYIKIYIESSKHGLWFDELRY